MGVLSLNVYSADKGVRKTLQFEPDKLVHDVCRQIRQKLPLNNINPDEYGLFRIDDDPTKGVWLDNSRTLEYYLVRNQDNFEYKRKIRNQKIRMLDKSTRTIQVDESQPVGRLMVTICTKIGISNYDEYSLVRDKEDPITMSSLNLREERSRSVDPADKQKGIFMGTLNRKKEKKLEQLKSTLHTDEELPWVDHGRTLREQGISEEETLVLRRKFFYSDTNVDSRDPVQLNLLYVQCRDGVLRGVHPVNKETACELAALQSQAEYGDFPRNNPKFYIEGRDVLPKEYAKNKENERAVLEKYKELSGLNELEAKSKYVHLCRGLKTYGVTFFVVKEKMRGKNKLVPRLLGVNKDSVMRVDEKTKDIMKEWPLEQVRKWAPGPKTFSLDFGDYQDGYYSVQTSDGDKIAQLIAGYIDIILKKRTTRDHLGIEGDEGSTMLEDVVTPARATLVSHGQIGAGQYAQDGHIALRGVMRTPQTNGQGYGINGAQYGAVSGEITTNDTIGRAQRTRIVDHYQQPQRALIGTIEATIRAVDRAEEELEREPEIEIPRFHDDAHQRRWVEEQVAVNKENVNERLAAMGAATAQVVQWTAVQEEYDDRVGTAIATIGSNLPDVGRNVRDLAVFMEERKGDDLVEAARKLCGAFGDFLHSVNPEHQEKRQVVLAAASKVGEFSRRVVDTMEEKTFEQTTFHDQLVSKAKDVATSTAQLVLRAKTISAECDEKQLQDNVIQSATQCAFATSQLVACTRVVAPTMESKSCQEQLTSAAKTVSTAVDELLVDAQAACQRSPDGQTSYRSLYEAAHQVTTALDGLLDHVKTSPRSRKTVEEEEYHKLLRTTNRMIANQGQDLTSEARKVIRHSQILQEQFEHEAYERPEQRDKLLDAARRVATATSHMIDATRECESRPTEAESEMALRRATEEMATVTHETTSDRQAKYIMEKLEQAAKETAYQATQAIAAANASKELIQSRTTQENLVYECTETAEHIPRMITSIRDSQSATSSSDKFRAQSRLIRDSTGILQPATRLVETASTVVSEVHEPHIAANLQQSSHGLSTALADLRTSLNDARQLNFSQQLIYSEELIRELDHELQDIQRAAQAGRLAPSIHSTTTTSTSKLMHAARQVGSGVAQLVSAAASQDDQHVGASAVEVAQGLRSFTGAVREVVATRKDIELDTLIVESKSVVHDTGRVFDRVREQAAPPVLAEAAKQVSVSLKKVIACLPDSQHVERAIHQIRTIGTGATVRVPDVRKAAASLMEATADLQAKVKQPGENEAVDIFVRCYTDFHTSAIASIKTQKISIQERAQRHEELETCRSEAIELLQRVGTPSEASYYSTQHFMEVVNRMVEHAGAEQPLEVECDHALHRLEAVRHLTEQATVPLSESSYWESLSTITDNSRRLGDAITEVARAVKTNDVQRTCESIRSYANTMCSMTEAASHSAYLVGVAHPKSIRGQAALIDAGAVKKSAQVVRIICERVEQRQYTRDQILEDGTSVAKHTSMMAKLCKTASERAANVNVKKQFINCAKDLASCTADLISKVKLLDQQPTPDNEAQCAEAATNLRRATEQLESYVDSPDFGAVPAKISPEGRNAQIPVLASSRQMLDASCEMVKAMKQLGGPSMDDTAWQRVAYQSKEVSDSIKRLVTSINDATPGVLELVRIMQQLEHLLGEIDRASMDAAQNPPQPHPAEEKRTHQHLLHVTQTLSERVNALRTAAVEKGEELGHCAEEHWGLIEPLALSACKAASIASDSRRQAELFDQCRTAVEAELVMMNACYNARGNPKAMEHHRAVDEAAAQLKDALAEMRSTVNRISSEQGTMQGLVETISHSIASSDAPGSTEGSFADAQTRMTQHLLTIKRHATDIPFAEAGKLSELVLHLSEAYRRFVVDSNQAVSLISSPNLGQKLKVAGQKLGTACIDTVRLADQRRAHPQDQRTQRELSEGSAVVIERVDEVLAALHEGSKGTQACINAANTVSGIIGDLDTTILFATSGSLNPTEAKDFGAHREAILKTAKALVEDTKALVAGAASNQEQLAVAAQNAVRTIVNLSDAVKSGATSLSADNNEAQVMVIHAVRDVASALSALISATKNAVGRSLHDPAMNSLKDAAKVMVSNVTSLLKTVKSVEDKQNQGTRALEAAIESIGLEINHYDREAGDNLPGTSGIAPEAMAHAAQKVSDVAHRIVGASESMSQADVIAAANIARAAVGEVLNVTKSSASNAESPEGRYRILDCGRDVAMQLRGLLVTLHSTLRSGDAANRHLLTEASRQVARSVRDLVGCTELLRGDEWVEADIISQATVGAEKELLVAANSIQQASVKLAELRPRVQHPAEQIDVNISFDGQILNAATSLTTAVHTLVKAASGAQRELIAQDNLVLGRLEPSARGVENYQWSEGLISAARVVVAAVHQLCDAANALVQGQSSEEKLISAAKQVASSTAQLLLACNVKADIDSQARKRLQVAGQAVRTATEKLVDSARHVVAQDERNVIIADRMVHGIAQVMDAQEQVVRKEKELQEARKQLATIHKARYERGGSPQ